MPISADEPRVLIDTSVAVALAVAGHEHHQATRKAIGDRSCGLSGHAAFETFSVLTRLQPPHRRTPGRRGPAAHPGYRDRRAAETYRVLNIEFELIT
jgi:uncharacterized protein with PIN domain